MRWPCVATFRRVAMRRRAAIGQHDSGMRMLHVGAGTMAVAVPERRRMLLLLMLLLLVLLLLLALLLVLLLVLLLPRRVLGGCAALLLPLRRATGDRRVPKQRRV